MLAQVIAFELDTGHHEALTLGDVEGDGNALLVRRNGHLRGVDLELQVTARQVVRTQAFDVRVELGTRITV